MVESGFAGTALAAVVVFALLMLAMAIGLLVRGTVLRGGCRSEVGADGEARCSTCGGTGSGECRRKKV